MISSCIKELCFAFINKIMISWEKQLSVVDFITVKRELSWCRTPEWCLTPLAKVKRRNPSASKTRETCTEIRNLWCVFMPNLVRVCLLVCPFHHWYDRSAADKSPPTSTARFLDISFITTQATGWSSYKSYVLDIRYILAQCLALNFAENAQTTDNWKYCSVFYLLI